MFLWVIAEIGASGIKGDGAGFFIGLQGSLTNFQRAIHLPQQAIFADLGPHGPGNRGIQHPQPSQCRQLAGQITGGNLVNLDPETSHCRTFLGIKIQRYCRRLCRPVIQRESDTYRNLFGILLHLHTPFGQQPATARTRVRKIQDKMGQLNCFDCSQNRRFKGLVHPVQQLAQCFCFYVIRIRTIPRHINTKPQIELSVPCALQCHRCLIQPQICRPDFTLDQRLGGQRSACHCNPCDYRILGIAKHQPLYGNGWFKSFFKMQTDRLKRNLSVRNNRIQLVQDSCLHPVRRTDGFSRHCENDQTRSDQQNQHLG